MRPFIFIESSERKLATPSLRSDSAASDWLSNSGSSSASEADSSDNDNDDAYNEDENAIIQRGIEVQKQSLQSMNRTHRLLQESEALGRETAEELKQQGAKLDRISASVDAAPKPSSKDKKEKKEKEKEKDGKKSSKKDESPMIAAPAPIAAASSVSPRGKGMPASPPPPSRPSSSNMSSPPPPPAAVAAPEGAPSAPVNPDDVMALIRLASASGQFELSATLAAYLHSSVSKLTKKAPGSLSSQLSLWATALVIALLDTRFAASKDQWELLQSKAKKLLAKKLKEVSLPVEDVMDAAQSVVAKSGKK
jgi:hypothetical protein